MENWKQKVKKEIEELEKIKERDLTFLIGNGNCSLWIDKEGYDWCYTPSKFRRVTEDDYNFVYSNELRVPTEDLEGLIK